MLEILKIMKEGSTKRIGVDRIETKLKSAVKKVMTSAPHGFYEDEVEEYSAVDVKMTEDGYIKAEIRAEVSYDGLMDLCAACDPIVQEYDPDAYFEPVSPGIISAYIRRF